jgi:hypothetical protein
MAHLDRVVMSVEPMNQRLDRRLVYVPDIGRRLPWFSTRDNSVGINESKRIYYHLSLYGLNGVDNHSYRTRIERLK